MARRRSNGGFTLVEVMVAIVILAVGITGAMQAVGASSRASAQARDTAIAASLARQVLNEMKASSDATALTSDTTSGTTTGTTTGGTTTGTTGQELTTGTQSGDFGADYPGYRWESDVEDSADISGLLQITVSVFWPNGTRENRLVLTTYYLPPGTGTTQGTTTGGTSTTGGSG